MAKITIPSIFGSPNSKKRSKALHQRSEDSLAVGPRPSSAPLSPRSKSVRTPPSARLRAQLQQLRPHSAISRSDSNTSSPKTRYDGGEKKEVALASTSENDVQDHFGNGRALNTKERDVKNARHTSGSPCQIREEKSVGSLSNSKSVETKARSVREGRHTPNSAHHETDETPELLVVLQEVRRKNEAAERKEWMQKWEGFADTLGSNIGLNLGEKRTAAEEGKKELGKAKSSNWLMERPKPSTRFPSDEKGNGLSERQKAMARLPIGEQDSPSGRGHLTCSMPADGEDSPLERKRPMARTTLAEPKGWESFVEERETINKGKRNFTPTERQDAMARLPIDEQKRLLRYSENGQHVGDGARNAARRSRKTSPEGDAPSTIHFSPRTLRTYVTIPPATKPSFELSPAPKRAERAAANRLPISPAPRTSSRSFSDASHSPLARKSSPTLGSATSKLARKGSSNSSIPQLAVPEDMAGVVGAEGVVARWQAIREALWYDSEDEEGDYAERMRLNALRSVLHSETAMG